MRYAELVHYRAPYRDQFVGCGQSDLGRSQYVEKGGDGVSRLRDKWSTDFRKLLEAPEYEVMSSERDAYVTRRDPLVGVSIIPCPVSVLEGTGYQHQGQAAVWVNQQLEQGNAVLVSLVSVMARNALCAVLRTVPVADVERMKLESSSWPVLAEPSAVQRTTSMLGGTLGVAAALAAVVGTVVWLSGVFKKRRAR